MMRNIFKVLRNIIARFWIITSFMAGSFWFLIYFLSGFIPRDKNLMIFGSWEGKKYCDNAKYLFLHIAQNHPEIRPVWLSRNSTVIKKIKADGYEAYHVNSWQGFCLSCRAKYIFITHGLQEDIFPYCTRKAVIFDLFHATFPIKKMGYDYFNQIPLFDKINQWLSMPFEFIKRDYTFSPSENVSEILCSALRVKKENIIVTGLPRSDYMLSKNNQKEEDCCNRILGNKNYKQLIYYIPTFRNRQEFNLYGFNYDEPALIKFLDKTDSVLLVRFHPFDAHKYSNIAKENSRIIIDRSDDLYPMLKKADILITDYSSVCYDFLLLDRPMIFANFDHENYIKERSFYYNYDQITPGPKAKDWNEVLNCLENSISSNKDNHCAERLKMRKSIYKHVDNHASKRIMNFIKGL